MEDRRIGARRLLLEDLSLAFLRSIGIDQPIRSTSDRHRIRIEWQQFNDEAAAVSDDLGVGVTAQERVSHHLLTELHRRLEWIGFIPQQVVERIAFSTILAAISSTPIQDDRQRCGRLRNDSNASVDSRDRERKALLVERHAVTDKVFERRAANHRALRARHWLIASEQTSDQAHAELSFCTNRII